MKSSLLAVAILATIAISSAVDEECVQRKLRGLPVHWPNPTHCSSFYRCTNKNVKRELLCPAGKEYNVKTGRCAPLGRNLCKLSLKAALDETTSPCDNELSGTYVADGKSCRGFNICNTNLAYPQSCDAGSYFNATAAACVPDTNSTCWENLCLAKDNGAYLADDNNCYSFYICSNQVTVVQDCPSGSYFNKETLNCRPGVCPSDITTEPSTDGTTTPCTTEVTTMPTTVPCADEVTKTPVAEVTTRCSEETTTTEPSTTEVITTATTEACTDEVTTTPVAEVTTRCSEEKTTTTPCTTEVTKMPTTVPCTDEVTTTPVVEVTTRCSEEMTTTEPSTTEVITTATTEACTDEVTTTPVVEVTTRCSEETTTTDPCTTEVITTATTEVCTDEVTTSPVAEVTTRCSEETTTTERCTTEVITTTTTEVCTDEVTTTPVAEVTTRCSEETTTTEPCTTDVITTATTEACTDEVTTTTTESYDDITTTPEQDINTPLLPDDCPRSNCDQSKCLNMSNDDTFPGLSGSSQYYCICVNQEALCSECPEGSQFEASIGVCLAKQESTTEATTPKNDETTKPCSEETTTPETTTLCEHDITTPSMPEDCPRTNCDQSKCVNMANDNTFPALSGSSQYYCICVNQEALCSECPEGSQFEASIGVCLAKQESTTEATTPKDDETTKPCSEETTTPETTTLCEQDITTPSMPEDCPRTNCDQSKCVNMANDNTFPALSGSSQYYCICLNQEALCSECPEGSQFEASIGVCLAKQESTTEATTPKDDETTKPCSEETTTPETTTLCEQDITTPSMPEDCPRTNCDQSKCVNMANDNTFPALSGSSQYYCICLNQEALCSECPEGSQFEASIGVCLAKQESTTEATTTKGDETTKPCSEETTTPETTTACKDEVTSSKCDQTKCKGAADLFSFPALDTNTGYCVCVKEQAEYRECADNAIYDAGLQICVAQTTAAEASTCAGGYQEGDFVANLANNKFFYICFDGELLETSCGSGNHYDAQIKHCMPDTNGENDQPSKPRSKRSVLQPISDTATCLGGIKNGEIIANPGNCSSYYECCSNELKEKFCDESHYFNPETLMCEDDVNSICRPGCKAGDISANSENCASYYVCCSNEMKEKFCDEGYYFNSQSNKCEEDVNYTCWSRCKEGEITANTGNCSSYNVCCNNEWKEESCSEGYIFNSNTIKCEEDVDYTCWPRCKEGDVTANTGNCSSYNVCCNNEWKEEFCSEGYFFNFKINQCEQDVDYTCWTRCKEGEITANTGNCSSYDLCYNNEWKVEFCSEGYFFNSKTNQCEEDVDYTCWPRCKEGEITANTGNCSSYNVCCNNEWMQEYCSEGYFFNSKTNQCEEDVDYTCWPGCKEGEISGNNGNCSSYDVCCNNEWKEEFCSAGYLFNSKTNQCEEDVDRTCWPGCKEGEILANNGNCSSYDVCCSNEWKEAFCSEGYLFNSKTNQCEEDVDRTCWPGCKEGEISANTGNCSSYDVCCNNEWKEAFCSEGYLFNSKTNQCEEDVDRTCWPGCKEGEISANTGNCSSYDVCCSNEWKEEFCSTGYLFNSKTNQCEEDVDRTCWPGCKEGEISANTGNCSSYVCCNNEWKEAFCSEGYLFNSKTNQCEEDVDHTCWPGCKEGEISANTGNCSSYDVCCSNEWKEEFCSTGYLFNSKTNQCEEDVDRTCWPGCKEGEISANTGNCSSYDVCCSNEWTEAFCSEGYLFNSKTNQCEEDVDRTCWPGCKEGEISSNTGNCSSYDVCCSNEWKEAFCSEGYLFNSKTNQCEEDVDRTCWPGCKEGEILANNGNCSSYDVCCSNEWKEAFCSEGYFFNTKTNQCEEDVDRTCWPGCKEGEILANTGNCSSYDVCCSNEWKEAFCSEGYLFNSKTNQCEEDVDRTCWPGCKEGEISANTGNCSSYDACCNNEWKEAFCSEGYFFNSKTNQCEEDVDRTCWPGCKEGEISANTGNCSSYDVCCSNEWKEEFCSTGYLFNSKTNQCEEDVDRTCWPGCKEGEISANTGNCSSYDVCCSNEWKEAFCSEGYLFNSKTNQCEEDVDRTCWPGCKEGEILANTDNCSSYYVCCNNELKERFCDEGYYFNSQGNKCEEDIGNICGVQPSTCIAGEQMQSLTNCSAYLACCGGVFKEQFCDEGSYFSSASLKCELDTENICWTKEPCTCTGGYEDGAHLASEDCDTFYICSDGELVLQDCGVNNYFNATNGICEPDTEHKCWLNYCADQTDGSLVANPKQCNAFYSCNGGESTDEVCPNGDWFDPTQSSCQPDVDAVCYNPCADEDKITVLPHPTCNKYYWCNGKHTLVGTCAVGGFNEILGSCDPKKSCSDNECDGKPNYYAYADPDSKTNFYICMSGVPTLKSCNSGTEFNGVVCAHVSDPDCDAAVCQTAVNYVPYPTLNATDDTAFCMCVNGYATKYDCPSDYVYSPDNGRCTSNAACDPMVCKSSVDYTVFVNYNDTNSFCMCVSNKPVVVPCPSGSFNRYTSSCTDVEMSEQCDQLVCRDQSNIYTYPSSNVTFNGFCRCQAQIGVLVDCPVNTVYDANMGLCKLTMINCDSSKCKGVADNTKLAALTTTQGYCECVAGAATYYNCENFGDFDEASQECLEPVCDPTKCTDASVNTAFPATGTTTGFCLCTGNGMQYRVCPAGGVFDNDRGTCKIPLKNCEDSMCAGQTDSTKVPAWSTVNGYCSCSGGKATYEDCLNDWVFDKVTQSCGPVEQPIEDVCDISYCNDPANAGAKYPSTSDVYGYCECSLSSGPTFKYCNAGEIFDSVSLECTPSAASQCELSLCASATPDNTYSTPAKNNDTFFCFCSGPNNVMLLQCPSGKYYNDAEQLCLSVLAEGCSCPNGLQNGDRTPDPADCTQYYICSSGSMTQQSCPSGQYFNTDSNCCRDDDGTCTAKEACTCLGAYREGERVIHPYNDQMFYVCENKMLHERNCGRGRIFNKIINQCMKAPRMPGHFMHKRSVDVDESRTFKKITNFFTKFLW